MKIRVLIAINDARASEVKTIEMAEVHGLPFALELSKFLDGWNTSGRKEETSGAQGTQGAPE